MADGKFTRLTDLLGNKPAIASQSAGHDAFFPTPVQVPDGAGSTTIRGQAGPASRDESKRGRILLFIPTKEKVTVIRERVGKSYNGDWLHEVTTRDGHTFLSLQKQLKDSVK